MFITDLSLFGLIQKWIKSDTHIVSPFDVFRSFLLTEDEIAAKAELFRERNEDMAKIFRLENPELAEDDAEARRLIRKYILPPWHAKSKAGFDRLGQSSLDEILEKYIVLGYLVDDTFMDKLKFDVAYFEHTVFRDFFEGLGCEDILRRIESLGAKYKKLFDKLHNWEIQRMLKLSFVGHRSDSKSIDFSRKAHEFLYDERPVQYLHSVLDEEKQMQTLFKLYYQEIQRLIFDEYKAGKIQFLTLLDFQKFSEGKFTAQNVSTFKRYFIRVNAQHGFMNLPSSFAGTRNIYGSQRVTEVSKILQDLTNKYLHLKRNPVNEIEINYFNEDDYAWEDPNDQKIWDFFEKDRLSAQELFLLTQTKGYMTFDLEKGTRKLIGLRDKFPEHGRMVLDQNFTPLANPPDIEITPELEGNDPVFVDHGRGEGGLRSSGHHRRDCRLQ